MNHVEVLEGFEVAIAALLEKMSICDFYAGIYFGVPFGPQSTENSLQLRTKIETALPELYAAVIVFAVKARTYYFEAGSMFTEYVRYVVIAELELGIKKISITLKSFDIEFLPFIKEITAKEEEIRAYADAATMERIRSKLSISFFPSLQWEKYDPTTWAEYHGPKSNASI